MNPRTRTWAADLMERLGSAGAPGRADCGSRIDHRSDPGRRRRRQRALAGTPVIASASHDTASAVAAITARDGTAFISSGTWSLVGTELDAPVLTPRAMQLNFSNEGGVEGTTRLLKNVMGLWLLQGCRRSWAQRNRQFTLWRADGCGGAGAGFRHLIDPDDASFANPDDMPRGDRSVLPQNGSARSVDAGRVRARRVRQPGAEVPPRHPRSRSRSSERPIARIRVIGGGSQNALLNQLTADATGLPVVAGPVEATALGNVAVQMLATGAAASLAEARAIIDRSFPTTVFAPRDV